MARYEITSPDGRRFEVTAPDDASQDDVLAYAQANFGAKEDQSTGKSVLDVVSSGVRGIVDDVTGGLSRVDARRRDESIARANAASQEMIAASQASGTAGELEQQAAAKDNAARARNDIVKRGINFGRDVAIGGAKGVANTVLKLPLAATGAVLDATGTRDLAESIGIRNRDALAAVSDLNAGADALKSDAGKARDAIYESTKGFTDTLLTLGADPAMLADKVSESLVGTVGVGLTARLAVKQAIPRFAAQAEAAGLYGKAAADFIADKAAKFAIGAAAVGEGAQGALDLAGTAQEKGVGVSRYAGPAVASGIGTAAIAGGSGAVARRLGIGDIEADIALRGQRTGVKTSPGFVVNRAAIEGFKEGALEEMPQSIQEAAWENVAMGRPWDEGLGKAAASGLATGAGMGGGHAAVSRPAQADDAGATQPPAAARGGAGRGVSAADVLGAPQDVPADSPRITEADKALYTPKSLTALDRAQAIDMRLAADDVTADEAADLAREREQITASWPAATPGAETSFSTETGARINGQYALMEAGDLTTSHDENLRPVATYPAELQPRERERHASEMQVQQIVGKLDPARLGESADAATGAPIVGADGLVESGNARTIALKRVYQANGQKAIDYRQFLKDNAGRFGITPESVDAMQKPVLVRVRSTPVNRAEFARQANASTVARMSPSEQARSDAAAIDSLDDLSPDDSGDFMSSSSRPFIRRFLAKLPATEQAGMIDATGQLSQAGYSRIRNAVLAKAYGDSPVLLRMVESLDNSLRNVTAGLMRVAPQVAKAREAMTEGALFDADITPDLLAAVEELAALRERGTSVADHLAQSSMFGDGLSPEGRELLTFLADNIRSPRRIAEFIQSYLDALSAAGNPAQGSMFGESQAPGKADLMAAARRQADDDQARRNQPGSTAADQGAADQGAGQRADQGGHQGSAQGDGQAGEWVAFPPDSGTLGIPRAEMPQIKGEHRGALIQFLEGQGITHETVELPANQMKPTQAEFSTKKAEGWKDVREGSDRSVLASSDGYILDGHHQWVAALAMGETEQVIRFSAPIRELLAATYRFPSAKRSEGANVVALRTQARQDFKAALADLAQIATRHTRAAIVPEDTPGLMPTLVKLFDAGIKEVGYGLQDLIAYVKKALRADPTFKTFWNKIDNATYRKAAKQAIEQESVQRVDDLFSATEQRHAQGNLFAISEQRTKSDRIRDALGGDIPDGVDVDRAAADLDARIAEANNLFSEFQGIVNGLAGETGTRAMIGPIKTFKRAFAKVVSDYNGDASKIKDLLRATLVADDWQQVNAAVEHVVNALDLDLNDKKLNRNWWAEGVETPSGYRDAKFVFPLGGLMVELQVNTQAMIDAKDKAHALYEKQEAIRRRAATRELSEDEAGEISRLDREMNGYYAAAFEASTPDSASHSVSDRESPPSEYAVRGEKGRGDGLSKAVASERSSENIDAPGATATGIPDTLKNTVPLGKEAAAGTFIAGTSAPNIAQRDNYPYTEAADKTGERDAQSHGNDSARGPEGQGAGAVSGSQRPRRAQRLREGQGSGDLFAGDQPGAPDGGSVRVQQDGRPDRAGEDHERRPAAGSRDRAGRATGIPAGRDIPAKSGRNYRFADGDLTYEGGWQKKAAQNVEAVELAKRLQAEGRQATRDEQAILAKFIGWGASEIRNAIFGNKLDAEATKVRQYEEAQAALDAAGGESMSRYASGYMQAYYLLSGTQGYRYGDPITRDMLAKARPDMAVKKWLDLRDRLKAALTDEELATAERSTQYAHYTSKAVVQSMWKAMERMGFKGGAILEPGAGIGVFPGLMDPAMATNSVYTGIEFDALTGEILKQLFPDERILVESFVDSALPDNFYDVAIGNPPFANIPILSDPKYKKHAFSLHDYFFAKSIDKVKPGGLMVYVTSRYTMDKQGDKARKYLADRADLVGAIRLPQTAFQKNAGTEVVTDVLFLRKKVDGEPFANGRPWTGVQEVKTPEGPAIINEYFVANPEMVLGTHSLRGSMYSKNEYTVLPRGGDIEAQFAAAVEHLPADIYRATGASAQAAQVREIDFNPKAQKEGNYYVTDAGVLMQREGGVGVRADAGKPEKTVALLKDFVSLRDALKQAHHDQLNDGPWETSLEALQKAYRAFVKRHGNILQNKAFERTVTREDEETGQEIQDAVTWRRFDLLNKVNDDPDYTLVEALEILNEETGEIRESKFLSERVLARPAAARVETPHDALLSVLNDTGKVDLPMIAQHLGLSEKEAAAALGTAIYEAPAGGWVMADEYLSGNVKQKLKDAQEAARADRRFERNVEALLSAQPAPVPPSDITAAIGMNWIPANVYEQFLNEKAGVRAQVVYNERTGQWTVTASAGHGTTRATVDWGTMDRNAADILDHALTGRPIRITRTEGYGDAKKSVFDAAATEAANQKLAQMRAAFSEWLWQDGERADALTRVYNDKFNTIVARKFDGRHLTLPGSTTTIKVFDHVKRGAWRIIQAGNTYLAHAVGSGKTWQMVISAMEQKRLGLIQKPMVVVPNHMLQQFAREWLQLYPAARLMVADEKQFHTDNRRRFVARVAMSDLDGVIITHSAFKLLDLAPEFKRGMIEEQLDYLRAALDEALDGAEGVAGKSRSRDPKVRDIQNRIEKMEQKLEAAMSSSGKDKNVRFDQLGVDMLYVDEAHEFRKLAFTTQRQVKGIDSSGSDRAFDLYMKTRWLEQKKPGRSLVMASGTPVTNTLAELYSVQRFMAPQVLDDRGLQDFDAWASMFGQENTEIEADASGKYAPVTRFTKFVNVPELTQMFREYADVLTSDHLAEMLGDKRPKVKDGSRKLVITAQTDAYADYKEVLAARLAESRSWKPSRDEPNNPDPIIKIIGDGRLAAIDMRFIDPSLPSDPESKLNQMIDGVIEAYRRTAGNEYLGKDGNPEPAKGGAQMVFSDLGFGAGVAEHRGFNARAWMEKRLRDAGIPPAQVAFMSDFKKSTAKLKLFQDVNAGRVRILVGSSKNMGTGVNAQQRLVALHHLDTPWYPADLEQREGRIIRQGNKNPLVEIYAYSTKGSYDTVMWQMLASKQRFIDQALSGDSSVRSIDDLTEASQFQIATAMTAGDPRAIQLAGLKADIEKYQRLFRAHEETRMRMRQEYDLAGQWATSAKAQLPGAEKLSDQVQNLTGDNFKAKADGKSYDKRKDWAEAILASLKSKATRGTDGRVKVGEISGFPVEFVGHMVRDTGGNVKEYRSGLAMTLGDDSVLLAHDPNEDPVGMSMRATNALAALSRKPGELRQRIEDAKAKRAALVDRLDAKFQFAQELADKLKEADALEAAMVADQAKVGAAPTAGGQEQASGDGGKLSRMDRAVPSMGGRMRVDDVRAVVDGFRKAAKNLPMVHVLQDTKDAPRAVQKWLRANDAMLDAAGLFHDGEVYLFANNLSDLDHAQRVFLHEAQHYGLSGLFGSSLDETMLYLYQHNGSLKLKANAKQQADRTLSKIRAVEEVLADMAGAGKAKTLNGWDKLVAAVRDWFRKAGWVSNVTDSDVSYLVYRAELYWKRAQQGGYTNVKRGKLSRATTADQAITPEQSAETIIQQKSATPRPVDSLLRKATELSHLDLGIRKAFDVAAGVIDRFTPETVKAGVISDYGVPEAVIDQRSMMVGRQKRELRAAGAMIEKLATLTRAESRVAYEWMNSDNPQAAEHFRDQLPPESIKTLAEVEQMIDQLSAEAVRLGQLTPEARDRNRFAYLHRSYVKHTAELTAGEARSRARAIAVLGDQYKGRGMTDAADMTRIKNTAPEWWNRKLKAGQADKQLVGERFIRLERRAAVGEGTTALPGMGEKGRGRLLEVAYWPAAEVIPARYGSWDQVGTWEARDTKGGKLILWRDFTKQEREAMGEIDEVRYAIAKTLHGMIHDVEVGRYLEWLAQRYAKKEGEAIDGQVVEASERMRDTFKPGEWVKVPDSVIPGTKVKRYGVLAGRYLPGPIWNDVRQVAGGAYRPLGEVGAQILRAWKTSKTALSPAVHMNNVMSNFVMADWHDVSAGHILKALRLMTSKDPAAQEVLNRYGDSGGGIGTWAAKELQQEQLRPLIESMEKELAVAGQTPGVQVGSMSAVNLLVHGKLGSAWDAIKPTAAGRVTGKAVQKMIDLYQAEDDVFRLAAWLKAKEDGATDQEAGKVARKSFLDYSINAPWIQAMRSTAFPFIAFTYRAVPMMLATMRDKPWKLAKLAGFVGALNALGYLMSGGDEDDERKLLPEEKAGRVWGLVPKLVRMPWNDANGSPVFLDIRRWIPVGDVLDTGQTHTAVPVLPVVVPGGPLAVLAEIVANRSQFTGREITQETDTAAEKAGKVIDHLWKAFAPNLPGLPGTYSTTAIVNAGGGKTDAFGREQSLTQAVISSMGIKVGSYPKDVLQQNAQRAAQARMMEIDRNITRLKRERQMNGLDDQEFQDKVHAQAEKKRKIQQDLAKRVAGGG